MTDIAETTQAEQLANEEFIEPILRKRSLSGELSPFPSFPIRAKLDESTQADLSAFKSRCPYFAPPSAANNSERQWWDLAESGRNGKGPNA